MSALARWSFWVVVFCVACGDDSRRPPFDAGGDAADSGMGDGGVADARTDADATSPDGGDSAVGDAGDSGATDSGVVTDTGMIDSGVDTTPTRFPLSIPAWDFDVDSAGNFAVVGRIGSGSSGILALTCSPGRTVMTDTTFPTNAMVRRSRTTGRTYVAVEVGGAGSYRAWALESTNGACDRPVLPAHAFEAAFVSGSFQAEIVHDIDVTDAGMAWVLSTWGTEARLTRFDGVSSRETRDVGCFPSFGPDAVRLALDPATGAGAVACAASVLGGIEIRRFDASGWLGTGFTAIAGTDSIYPQSLEMTMGDGGVIALSWRGRGMPVTTEVRHLTTVSASGVANDLDLGAAASPSMVGYEDFVRDRRLPPDFVVVERVARTLGRYSSAPASLASGTAPTYVFSSPVRVDGYGRTWAFDAGDLTRSDFMLP